MTKSADKSSITLQKTIRILVSFIQCLLISLLAICLSLLTILTPQFAKSSIKASGYVDYALAELTEDLNDIAIPSGLPSDFFNDKFEGKERDKFEELLISRITSNIKQSSFNIETTAIDKTFRDFIEDYAEEHLGTLDTVSEEALSELVNECTKAYIRYLCPEVLEMIFQNFPQISKLLLIAAAVVLVLLIVASVFLYKLCDIKELFFLCFSSFLGSGLILGALPSYLLFSNQISKINILSDSLYNFLVTFVSKGLITYQIAAVVLIVLSLACLYLKSNPSFIDKYLVKAEKTLDKRG